MSDNLPRRDFLKLAWGAMGTAAAAATGYVGLRFLDSRVTSDPFGGEITAGVVTDFPPGTVTPFNQGQFYLIRFNDGGFLALYRKCPHLDCVVLWKADEGRFHCPCHGSIFERDGAVLNPPSPRSMARFPVVIDERGVVVVDTGTVLEREDTGTDERVYPSSDT